MTRFSMGPRATGMVCALVACAAIALVLTVGSPSLAHVDAAAAALARVDDEWSAAAATRDAERVASYYAEHCYVYPPGAPAVHGRAAAQEVWAQILADPSFTISWKTVHADIAKSGEMGITSGTFENSWTGPDGEVVRDKGNYLCTWRLEKDGSWKAVHDMWNSDGE